MIWGTQPGQWVRERSVLKWGLRRSARAQGHAELVRFDVVECVLHHLLHLLLCGLEELGRVHLEAAGPTSSHKRNRHVTIGIVAAVIR